MFNLMKLFESKAKKEELHKLLDLVQKLENQDENSNPFTTIHLTDKEKSEVEKYRNRVDRGLTEYEMDRMREKIRSVDL